MIPLLLGRRQPQPAQSTPPRRTRTPRRARRGTTATWAARWLARCTGGEPRGSCARPGRTRRTESACAPGSTSSLERPCAISAAGTATTRCRWPRRPDRKGACSRWTSSRRCSTSWPSAPTDSGSRTSSRWRPPWTTRACRRTPWTWFCGGRPRLSHPVRVLGHVRRALKEGGRVVLVEFRSEDRGVPIKLRHKMSKAQVVREMAANGFRLADETDALPWQHAMAFEAAPADPRLEARELARVTAQRADARVLLPYLAPLVTRAAPMVRTRTSRPRCSPGPWPTRCERASRPSRRGAGSSARRGRWPPHGGARAAGGSSHRAAARPRRRGPLAGRGMVGSSAPRTLLHGHAHRPRPP